MNKIKEIILSYSAKFNPTDLKFAWAVNFGYNQQYEIIVLNADALRVQKYSVQ